MNTDVTNTRLNLSELPALYQLLPLFVLGTGATEERTATTSPARPPANLGIFDRLDTREKPDADLSREDFDLDRRAGARRQGVLPTLVAWTRLADGELWDAGLVHPPPFDEPSVASECAFLAEHLEWLAEQRWFGELAADVQRMRQDMRQAVREYDLPPLVCTIETCRWTVEIMDDWSWFRCTGCGRTWTRIEVYRLYQRQKPMPLSECAKALGKPLKTLQRWHKEGWLKPCARESGTALFRLIDVQTVALTVVPGQKTDTTAVA